MDAKTEPAAGTPASATAAWDRFVAETPDGCYLQTAAWARAKEPNGWSSARVTASGPDGPIGIQVLLQHRRPLPWAYGYAPRGPVTQVWTPAGIASLTDALRREFPGKSRLASIRLDPGIELDGPDDAGGALRGGFTAAGWRSVPPVQPPSSRVIDLHPAEDALWGDLRGKWRQYINAARRAGVTVVEDDGSKLPVFHQIVRETAGRTGMGFRTEASYKAVWDAFHPTGDARLLFALGPDGDAQAALFLVRCGTRVVEPYGGMTAAGADSRANYLIKWEAMTSSRTAGATSYDLWGLVNPGIAHFKAGFGGREIRYVGGFELDLARFGAPVVRTAAGLRQRFRGPATRVAEPGA
jgi:lipid II:glycine glycyltransferase (peptidoglycan interpeptide bridge formation enzyme)